MFNYGMQVMSRTYAQLQDMVRPKSADEPESFADVLYDTQQAAAAGQARLTFFNNTAANMNDATLSNRADGTLEKGTYFEVARAFLFIMSVPTVVTTAAVTGSANDVELLLKTSRPVVTFKTNAKDYGPIPLEFLGRPGGPSPFAVAEGTETAPARNFIQFGNTESNGGFPYGGSIVIPPQTKFTVLIDFNSTAINAATNLRYSLLGVRHRLIQ